MSTANTRTENSNVFYVDVMVFLEGVQVPHMSASVSYGTGEPPTCTITIPANNFLRQLPSATKVLIVFRDLLPDSTGIYQWRVLFDGELSAINYTISPEGAYLTMSAIHTTAYLTLMQLISLPANEFIFQKEYKAIGETAFASLAGASSVMTDLIRKVMNSKQYENMADLVYLLVKNILEGYKSSSSTGQWYWEKLGNDLTGYKIMDRIYGVSEKAKQAQLAQVQLQGKTSNEFKLDKTYSTTEKNLVTTKLGTYTTVGSYGNGSTSYSVYQATGAVGTGGVTAFGSSMTDQAYEFVKQGTTYKLGASGYTSNDCGQSVKECLEKTIGQSLPEFPRYVPDQIIWAKQNGYWHEGSEAMNAKAGDAIIVNGDAHSVISDGMGGYWGMSSSANKMSQNSSVLNAFDNKVTGYIDLNKFYEDKRGTR